MTNQWLCFLFQASVGPVFGFAMDSMQPPRKNAPAKWVRVGLWTLSQALGSIDILLWRTPRTGVNLGAFVLSFLAAWISFAFFYETSFRRQLFITMLLILTASVSELFWALVLWLFQLPALSADYAQPDMVLAVLIGSFGSNTLLFFTAALWRRLRLDRRMPRGSAAFVIMPLCLFAPTAIYSIDAVRLGSQVSSLHILSMAGALLLSLLLICVQFNQAEKEQVERELSRLRHEAQLERQHYESVEARREEMGKIRQDYNRHLTGVLTLLEGAETEEAEKRLLALLDKVESTREYPYCTIPIVNAILSEKEGQCRKLGITLRADLLFAGDVAVAPIDLCSIFGNLLDNAIRACTQLPPDRPREITLEGRTQGDYLLIRCDNPALRGPGPKPEGSGYGMKILRDIAHRYAGQFTPSFENGTFTARLVLLGSQTEVIP